MPDELKPLRFAAGKCVERLTEAQIAEPNFFQERERPASELLRRAIEKLDRLTYRQLQNFVNRAASQFHLQHMRLETTSLAFRAADVEVAQELHLDFLKTGPAAALATSAPGVEGKCARGQTLRHRFRLRGEELTHAIVNPEVKNRRRARGAGERGLVDHHDLADAVRAGHAFAGAGFFAAGTAGAEEILVKDFVNQGRFA